MCSESEHLMILKIEEWMMVMDENITACNI